MSNPFAPPTGGFGGGASSGAIVTGQAWAEGPLLVTSTVATLPDGCVVCGGEGHQRVKGPIQWIPLWVRLSILLSPLIMIVLMVIFRRQAVVDYGLCEEHFQRRNRMRIGGGIALVAGMILMFGSIALIDALEGGAFGFMLVGLVILLGGAIALGRFAAPLMPKHIDREYARFTGVHPAYLDRLPPWTGG